VLLVFGLYKTKCKHEVLRQSYSSVIKGSDDNGITHSNVGFLDFITVEYSECSTFKMVQFLIVAVRLPL
jgi:hypothetical protein